MAEPLIELRNVSKHFAGVRALTDVSIAVHPGEVVCLLGDNGAGKSTLIKILSGFHPPSSGSIYLDGQETRFADPRDARSRGIATVHQEVGTIPLMSVGRNFFLGAELKKGRPPFRWLDTERCNSIALEQIRKFGITRVRDGDQLVGTLSGGERQVIAIGRAMYFGAKVLILDEPTSALGVKEASTVLQVYQQREEPGRGRRLHHAQCASCDVCRRPFRRVDPGAGRRQLPARGEEQHRGSFAHGGRRADRRCRGRVRPSWRK